MYNVGVLENSDGELRGRRTVMKVMTRGIRGKLTYFAISVRMSVRRGRKGRDTSFSWTLKTCKFYAFFQKYAFSAKKLAFFTSCLPPEKLSADAHVCVYLCAYVC